jgi:hypothetical protein
MSWTSCMIIKPGVYTKTHDFSRITGDMISLHSIRECESNQYHIIFAKNKSATLKSTIGTLCLNIESTEGIEGWSECISDSNIYYQRYEIEVGSVEESKFTFVFKFYPNTIHKSLILMKSGDLVGYTDTIISTVGRNVWSELIRKGWRKN